MTDPAETTIKVISFDGTKDQWPIWSIKFLARLNKKGIKYILEERHLIIPVDDEEFDVTTESGVRYQKIRNDNARVFEDLVLSVDCTKAEGRIAFALVKRALDANYKNGNSRKAWQNLKERYEPKTVATRARLMEEYINSHCKYREDPALYVVRLEDLKNRLVEAGGAHISDKDFMTQVLNTLPEFYSELVQNIEDKIDDPSNPLTLGKLMEKLSLKYERKFKTRTQRGTEETALVGFNTQYKKSCGFCGKIGHKSVNCFEHKRKEETKKKNNKAKGSKMICSYCLKVGHTEASCFKKKRDNSTKINYAGPAVEQQEIALSIMDLVEDPAKLTLKWDEKSIGSW